MRKVLCHIFFDEYPNDSRVRRYTNKLIENGFKVIIISIQTENRRFYENKGNLVIFRFPIRKRRGSFIRRIFEYFMFQVYSFMFVPFIMIRYRPSFYHVHTLPDFLIFSTIIPKLFGAKIFLDFHELFPEFMMQYKPNLNYKSFLVKLLKFIEKISSKFSTENIVFSDVAKEILIERIKGIKVTTIMNGVDDNEIVNFEKKKCDFTKLIYNGTINYNLNLSIVIYALEYIKENMPEKYRNIFFFLYGDGPDLNNILKLAREKNIENVIYKGKFSFEDLLSEIKDSSACVVPPLKDIYSELYYSIKITEMIYLKIPVIATRLKTYQHYYDDRCLLYFESGNVNDLVDKIIFVNDNKAEVDKIVDNALIEYNKYNWNIMSERYINLINRYLIYS